MPNHFCLRALPAGLVAASLLWSQTLVLSPGERQAVENQRQVQQPPAQRSQPAPGTPQGQPAPQATAPQTAGTLTDAGGFLLQNVSLVELVDILAKRLKINYILDPRVKGSVTINTYGEVRQADLMTLMQTILRINGCTIVKVGDLYRIVPVAEVSRLPLTPLVNGKDLPDDERTVLNLIFLKYTTVDEMAKLLEPFLGEGAKLSTYGPANLLLILDNARNMKRGMDLLALFDSDSFAGQRVRLFDVGHSRPGDLSKELETVFKAYALTDKSSPVRFIPVDRINTIVAVAPNPGIFVEVQKWIDKLDAPAKAPAGALDNFVYRLKYGRAETIAMAIMALYSGNPMALAMLGGMSGGGMYSGGMSGGGMGMYGGGMYGSGMYGSSAYGAGMYGGGAYGAGMYGSGMGMYGQGFGGYNTPLSSATNAPAPTAGGSTTATAQQGADLTGSYLGFGSGSGPGQRIPHVIPNPFDNTLLVQATPQEWEQILRLLRQLDVPPRQVLIEAKIYEVSLKGAFASGVSAFLNRRDNSTVTTGTDSSGTSTTAEIARTLLGSATGSGVNLSAGMLVGRSRQLLAVITAQETSGRSKIISEPSVIATDSIMAQVNVGEDVPTLSSQSVSPIQSNGSSLFANTIQTRSAGVNLGILARVNSSGVVTLVIQQEVSSPIAPAASAAIQSPSFSKRTVQTQVTVQDGDTIAIGGFIQETDTHSSGGVPVLQRIPVLGGAFGNRNITRDRTELVVFLTPRVIYDTTQVSDASDELTQGLKRVRKIIRDDR